MLIGNRWYKYLDLSYFLFLYNNTYCMDFIVIYILINIFNHLSTYSVFVSRYLLAPKSHGKDLYVYSVFLWFYRTFKLQFNQFENHVKKIICFLDALKNS